MDYFLYNGPIERGLDIEFIELVNRSKSSDTCSVVMVSGGGSPDAAYKMARYLHHKYEAFHVIVPSFCKSAATLFAVGAKSVVFAPYGELGPLDIQLRKADDLVGQESGLNLSEAMENLEDRALSLFHRCVTDIIGNSGGAITFKTAAEDAIGLVRAVYEPISAQFEPEEMGSRIRAMKIGVQYAQRLNAKFRNLTPQGESFLANSYPSHGFVIDYPEAKALFQDVRLVNDDEKRLLESLEGLARSPGREKTIRKLEIIQGAEDADAGRDTNTPNGSSDKASKKGA